ncbi:Outer membrane protein transport protein (OMPP1/FadL/TodX) [Moraxella lacunata]|uniref:Outer membrane protein transport protein (OMPP1/FadL/TodX) n=1 Tax=Moraxella lacunata TaxID=477 RepID=A0A378QHK8_MORLA|nr:outer membrane protein transport protein [Moraxella lacunata]STZ00141.1 Outer membrane protein transport protein (OMPP1/FadL/TodX) [Moraxella lacunata]
MFNYKHLAVAIASISAVGVADAAGLDRSGQDITAFLQDGTYGEVVYTYIDADISGKDTSGNSISDIAEAYDFGRFGVKADINDTFSVGVLYDEPWGAAVQYGGSNNFVSDKDATTQTLVGTTAAALQRNPRFDAATKQQVSDMAGIIQTAQDARDVAGYLGNSTPTGALISNTLNNIADKAEELHGQGTNVEIRTQNATLLLGAKLGENKNFQIYGGPQMQRLTGEVHLRGTAYGPMTGYDANIGADMGYGWVAGVAYSKPEIALKAALTYRSEIDHERSIAEIIPATGYESSQNFKATLPESWNLDFQTGINPTTLLTAKVRYVPWSDFNITPPQYSETIKGSNPVLYPNGLPIVRYEKDQWSAEVGLGKKLSDKVSVSGNLGYDSGAGNPVSTLGPIKGYYSLGLGAKYNITPEWSVSVGGKYLKFGDATAQLPNGVKAGEFDDNDGFIAGVKLAYQQK